MNTCSWIMDNDEPCGNLCEGRTNFCSSHNRQLRREASDEKKAIDKRKALMGKPKKVYAEPKKVSDKRKELNKEYKILADEFKREHPQCEIKANVHCTFETTDVHHPGGRIGAELLNVKRWKACCRSCHMYAHDHPKEAKEKGWSSSRLQKENPVI